jgi:hypothetical protein
MGLKWKSIVQPSAVASIPDAHFFELLSGLPTIDERKVPITKGTAHFPTAELLRINHYFTRSRQEFAEKINRPFGMASPKYAARRREVLQRGAEWVEAGPVRDTTILRFAETLRQRMGSD